MDGEDPLDDAGQVSQTISPKALMSEVGDALGPISARAIQKAIGKTAGKVWVPNHEVLHVGDVLLSRPNGKQKPNITKKQMEHGRSAQAARWTHAMLYVGNLHIIESNPPSLKNMRNGVRISPFLVKETDDKEYILLRHRSPLFLEKRFSMVRRALLEYHINKTRYDIRVAWDAFNVWKTGTRRAADLTSKANCSEFVLSCFANGAEALVKEYVQVHSEEEHHFFFPADLYDHSDFKKLPLNFFDIETSH